MKIVREFEQQIAEFYQAPFAVATDSCTHAVELCLRYQPPTSIVTIPARTYISIPFTLIKLNIPYRFLDTDWKDYYFLEGTNIVDAAVYFQKNGYVKNTLMCLSFQYRKTLSLGRGGAILCSSQEEYDILKRMCYDGRADDAPWREQNIKTIGYHYYMTPETALLGIERLQTAVPKPTQGSKDYPYLSNMEVFKYLKND
jgi:dTDP-4-amino-4,6-dideoxygalactose transaminase